MPRLSIVIPWIGPAGPFEETLAAVLQNRPPGCEVIVALQQTYDDPYDLVGEVTFVGPPPGRPDLVTLVNLSLPVASAPVLQVIPCGYLVEEGWASAPLLHFSDPNIAAVTPVITTPGRRTHVVSAGVNYSPGGRRLPAERGQKNDVARLVHSRPLGATLAGGFFRRDVLQALGGFDASLGDELADVDMALALAELGLRTECEPTSQLLAATTASRRASFRSGCQAERLFWRHLPQRHASQAKASHLLDLFGECCRSLVQPWWLAHLAGRPCGWLQAKFDHLHANRIQTARQRLAEQEAENILRLPARSAASGWRKAA